jgi:hypothetical protein
MGERNSYLGGGEELVDAPLRDPVGDLRERHLVRRELFGVRSNPGVEDVTGRSIPLLTIAS